MLLDNFSLRKRTTQMGTGFRQGENAAIISQQENGRTLELRAPRLALGEIGFGQYASELLRQDLTGRMVHANPLLIYHVPAEAGRHGRDRVSD
jgi:hypothetical protein